MLIWVYIIEARSPRKLVDNSIMPVIISSLLMS